MSTGVPVDNVPARQAPRPPLLKRLWRTLRSLRFALVLMALIAVACTVGTLIKQEPYDANHAIAHYGKTLGLLTGLLGLNNLYHTFWFLALLALFALSTVACALPRLRFRARTIGSGLVHLSIVFIVAGAIVKGAAGIEGMVQITEGHAIDSIPTEGEAVPLGFQVRLDDFAIERYEGSGDVLLAQSRDEEKPRQMPIRVGETVTVDEAGSTVEVLRYVPHFVFRFEDKTVVSASDDPVNPAIQVRVKTSTGDSTQWLFSRFPDPHKPTTDEAAPALRYIHQAGPIKAFASHVTVLDEQGQEIQKATILVNQPLRHGRYTFYQSSYDKETEQTTVLEVVYDPGVWFVYIGFILMPLGMAYVFYIQPVLRRRARNAA